VARFSASEPYTWSKRARAILSFANLRWNVRNARWCSEQEISPNITLALFTKKYTPHKNGTVLSRYIYLVKTEKMPPNFLLFPPFCSNVPPSAHAGKKIIKFAPNSQLDRAYASRAAFLSRRSTMPQSCTR
jgi:hypothetical protein